MSYRRSSIFWQWRSWLRKELWRSSIVRGDGSHRHRRRISRWRRLRRRRSRRRRSAIFCGWRRKWRWRMDIISHHWFWRRRRKWR